MLKKEHKSLTEMVEHHGRRIVELEAENQRMKAIIGNIIAAYEGNHAYVDVAEEIEIAKQEIEK